MTLLIGINLGEYAIIGADTRVNQGPARWEDGNQKIQIVPTGLMAGAGLAVVHDEVRAALLRNPQTRGADIAATARAVCERWRGQHRRVAGADLVDVTQFIMTMQGAEPGSPLFLNVWHPEQPDALLPVVQNRGFPIMPIDTNAADLTEVDEWLQREVRPIGSGDELETVIRSHTRLIGAIISSIAQKSTYVSESFSVGVHFRAPQEIRLSEIMRTPDDFLRWAR
jgi:hypothetical protein